VNLFLDLPCGGSVDVDHERLLAAEPSETFPCSHGCVHTPVEIRDALDRENKSPSVWGNEDYYTYDPRPGGYWPRTLIFIIVVGPMLWTPLILAAAGKILYRDVDRLIDLWLPLTVAQIVAGILWLVVDWYQDWRFRTERLPEVNRELARRDRPTKYLLAAFAAPFAVLALAGLLHWAGFERSAGWATDHFVALAWAGVAVVIGWCFWETSRS
jgi:hypothetical protein